MQGRSDDVGEDVRDILAHRYLLSVSTIERRKNHETLCRAYARLVDWGVRDLPRLVLVGGIGVAGQALIDEIAADRRISERVVVLSDVSDAGLAALYEGCLFTLYPSLYEGWGLPVSESLASGKFCLASNQAALREAGEEFVDYLDPWDVEEWANRILRYLSTRRAGAARADIRQSYRPFAWRASARRGRDRLPARSEQPVDERYAGGTAEDDECANEQQSRNHGQQPPFLVLAQKVPELRDEGRRRVRVATHAFAFVCRLLLRRICRHHSDPSPVNFDYRHERPRATHHDCSMQNVLRCRVATVVCIALASCGNQNLWNRNFGEAQDSKAPPP